MAKKLARLKWSERARPCQAGVTKRGPGNRAPGGRGNDLERQMIVKGWMA